MCSCVTFLIKEKRKSEGKWQSHPALQKTVGSVFPGPAVFLLAVEFFSHSPCIIYFFLQHILAFGR